MKNNVQQFSVDLAGKNLHFQTGRMAHQADGAVEITYGENILLATAMMSDTPREGMDFFPLLVEFDPKFYATGKIKGSRFMKREARPPESAILTARMIDRPLRPMFPKGIKNDVQISLLTLQGDLEHSYSATAINGASLAALLGGLPLEDAISAVRVGMKDGNFFLDPTFEESEKGDLDLLVAGTEETILMVEAGANLISSEKMLEALKFAHEHVKTICKAQKEFVAKHEVEAKIPVIRETDTSAEALVDKVITEKDLDGVIGVMKKDVKKKIKALEEKLFEAYAGPIENEEVSKGALADALNKRFAKNMRKRIFEKGERVDGRKMDEIRPLHIEVGLFPRVHGSALFQRGETQALSMTSVGGPSDAMIVDDPDRKEQEVSYIHHYNFPSYSVGEVRPSRGPGRREIGHGALAERALKYVVPNKEDDGFPYFVRVVSEILTCNGSSSMASVCGSTLSLMDAGIPIKRPIAGIAMGLMTDKETGDYRILSDIQGLEDFDGDMDFKVTGDDKGITALQLDMKLKGLPMNILEEALAQAQVGRVFILEAMLEVLGLPREKMSEYAPQIVSFHVNPDFLKVIIGKGGEMIQGMCKEFEVKIDLEDDGLVMVAGLGEGLEKAVAKIKAIAYEPEIGSTCDGIVKNIMDFGAFVEYAHNQEALVHVSEMANERVAHPSDVVQEGQKVRVKIVGKDKMGRIQLSMKQAE